MTPNNTNNTFAGKYVFVSGIAGGREVFLGRAIDEPFQDQLSIEGKPIAFGVHGQMIVRPFVTRSNFAVNTPNIQIQVITTQEVINEITDILNGATTNLTRWNHPLAYRWIESTMCTPTFGANTSASSNWSHRSHFDPSMLHPQNSPFTAFYVGFQKSVEQFRRALFTSPQVNTTTEMDKITELEGNLAIGVGKVTNEIAIKFNSLMNREVELTNYFEWTQSHSMPQVANNHMTGWTYLNQRLQIAKSWARRHGKAPLVREINNLYKEAVKTLNEIILDHSSTLDTLITETCSQYGIPFEVFGEMSPLSDINMSYAGKTEGYSYDVATGATVYPQVPVGV